LELDDSRVTEYKNLEKKFNVPDGHHIENRFDHNSAGKCDCAISVKFCEGMQFFFTEFTHWDRYPRSTECISCFPNAVWASASSGF